MNCPHCNVHIDEHPASRCLDAWVAEVVMGYTIEKRLCSPGECGYHEIESLYVEDDLGLYSPGELEKSKQAMPERVMWCFLEEDGWWEYLFHFSASIAVAWEVVEKLNNWEVDDNMLILRGQGPLGFDEKAGWWDADIGGAKGHFKAKASTAPLAICRAAIKQANKR